MTTENKILALSDFKQVVQHAPLFAIDLVVLNERNDVLVGERVNAPAKGAWFVPGGRVYKNESLEEAFKRISLNEIGIEIERKQAGFLGLFDHFYEESFFSQDVSTHYINATHVVHVSTGLLVLPKEQHETYHWLPIDNMQLNNAVHKYSKIFLPELKKWIEDHD